MSESEISIKEFNCKKCNAVDNNRMVQCDKCDQWYHYDCVAVNSGVADESWSCEECHLVSDEASGGNKTTIAENIPSIGNSTGLLRQPKAASSPTITGEKQQMASKTTTETGNVNLPSTDTNANMQFHVQQNNSNMRVSYSTGEPTKPTTSSATTASLSFPFNKNKEKTNVNQQNVYFSPHVDLQLKFLEEQQRLQQEFLERKYRILSQVDESVQFQQNPFNVSNNLNFMSGPTSSQLAARQAIPRDLPHFNGDPDDWPLFISSFETSTTVAGYSHAENLIRLQSCLKGRAKELVKSKLMLPAMVPEIIHTLKMCFGRPEHILERVIEKARKLQPPKDKLESMIKFALCVKNIYSTMETCKMEAHMNNPLLVKELLDKLSSKYKLNWAMYPKDDSVPIIKTFSDWIYQIADAASTVVSVPSTIKNVNVNTHTEEKPPFKTKCCLCSSEHKISVCSEFKNLPLDKKWDIVKKNNLCRTCLNRHKGKCFSKRQCSVEGCTIRHHQLLHKYRDEPTPSTSQQAGNAEGSNTASGTINSHSSTDYNQTNIFRILPFVFIRKMVI